MPEQQQKTLRQLKERQQRYNDEIKACYERVFDTIDGKKVLEDILRSAHVGGDIFDTDPLVMARDAGIQAFANAIKRKSIPLPEDPKPQQIAE